MANTCAFAAKTGKIKCFHIDSRNYKGSDEAIENDMLMLKAMLFR